MGVGSTCQKKELTKFEIVILILIVIININ